MKSNILLSIFLLIATVSCFAQSTNLEDFGDSDIVNLVNEMSRVEPLAKKLTHLKKTLPTKKYNETILLAYKIYKQNKYVPKAKMTGVIDPIDFKDNYSQFVNIERDTITPPITQEMLSRFEQKKKRN